MVPDFFELKRETSGGRCGLYWSSWRRISAVANALRCVSEVTWRLIVLFLRSIH